MTEPTRIHFIVDMDEAGLNFSPNQGIGYLSSFLRDRSRAVESSVSYLFDDIVRNVRDSRPDIIGFSCTSRYFTAFREIASRLKEQVAVPILWGGVHISIAPQELPECCDVGVLGEGEETLLALLDRFRGGRFDDLGSVEGIAYRDRGRLIVNRPRPLIEDLDAIPYPDFDLLRLNWNRHRRASMITSRGCPFKCRFCASSKYWDRIRYHSPEYVVGQMKFLVGKYRVGEILIYDDFFTMNRKRIAAIADLVTRDRSLRRLRFECLSRIDNFDEFIARRLKEMGVYRISFGIESGCQKTLDYLKNKTLKLDQVRNGLRIARSAGFECVGSFVIGSPFETADEIEQTLSFIRELDLDSVQITIATPFPGTELWEDGKRIGRIRDDAWSDDYYVMYANTPGMDYRKLLKDKILLSQVERDRFLELYGKASRIANRINYSPANIVKIAARSLLKDPAGFPGKAVAGLKGLLQRH